jgi:hypothetical protein
MWPKKKKRESQRLEKEADPFKTEVSSICKDCQQERTFLVFSIDKKGKFCDLCIIARNVARKEIPKQLIDKTVCV